MKTLTELILEAPIRKDLVQGKIDKKERFDIYYRGDVENPKGWYKVEPISLKKYPSSGKEYLTAYVVKDKKTGATYDFKSYFTLDLITNANFLSKATSKDREEPNASTDTDTREKEEDPITDAVVNKRKVSFYYKGDKENKPGMRDIVWPVCYGTRQGVKYVRAWLEKGVSVSTDKRGNARPGWRLYRIDRIRNWKVRGTETFNKPPDSNFNRNADKFMDAAPIAISKFDDEEGDTPVASQIGPKPSSDISAQPKPKKKKTISAPAPTSAKPEEPAKPEKKDVKGAAKPGSKKVNIYSKGAARPGATKPADDEESNIKESFIMEGILDALRIF